MDGVLFYGGMYIYSGSVGGKFVVNIVDLFMYLLDLCINMSDMQCDEYFGLIMLVGVNWIFVVVGQNLLIFYFYYFNVVNGYIVILDGLILGFVFNMM